MAVLSVKKTVSFWRKVSKNYSFWGKLKGRIDVSYKVVKHKENQGTGAIYEF